MIKCVYDCIKLYIYINNCRTWIDVVVQTSQTHGIFDFHPSPPHQSFRSAKGHVGRHKDVRHGALALQTCGANLNPSDIKGAFLTCCDHWLILEATLILLVYILETYKHISYIIYWTCRGFNLRSAVVLFAPKLDFLKSFSTRTPHLPSSLSRIMWYWQQIMFCSYDVQMNPLAISTIKSTYELALGENAWTCS